MLYTFSDAISRGDASPENLNLLFRYRLSRLLFPSPSFASQLWLPRPAWRAAKISGIGLDTRPTIPQPRSDVSSTRRSYGQDHRADNQITKQLVVVVMVWVGAVSETRARLQRRHHRGLMMQRRRQGVQGCSNVIDISIQRCCCQSPDGLRVEAANILLTHIGGGPKIFPASGWSPTQYRWSSQPATAPFGFLASLGAVDAVRRCKHAHRDKHGHKLCIMLVFGCGSSKQDSLVTYIPLA